MTRLYTLIFISLFSLTILSAQCGDVDAGPDQHMCSVPGVFSLDGDVDSDAIIYYWTPEDGLSDPTSLSTEATIDEETTYCLVAQFIDNSINLVENGDFEGGDSGFDTDYELNANPVSPANELAEGQYVVGSDPAPMHRNWADCGDHTSGGGEMLIANGATSAGQSVWCQDVSVEPDTYYSFSAWVTSVDPNGPVEIEFQIDGSGIGDSNVALSSTCDWVNFMSLWYSDSSTSITICIEDVNTNEPGNDFAIDDIVFSPLCEAKDSLTLTVSDFEPEVYNDTPICEGYDFILEATGGTEYEWEGPMDFSSTDGFIEIEEAIVEMTGEYSVTITDDFDCEDILYTEVFVYGNDTLEIIEYTCDSTLAGIFEIETQNMFDCDSVVTRIVEYVPSDSISISLTSCDSMDVGTLRLDLSNQYGCDSIVIIETSFSEADSTFIYQTTCDSLMTSDTMIQLTNAKGCDSLVFTSVSFVPSDSTFIFIETCDITLLGTNEIVMTNISGCDSIITTEFLQAPSDTTYLFDTTCDLSIAGTNRILLQNRDGCDSLILTEISLLLPDSTYLFDQTCDLALTGIFTTELQNQFGCDSLIFTDVSLIQADSTFLFDTSCDPALIGVFTTELQNQDGCDSLLITEVAYLESDTSYLYPFTCDPSMEGITMDMLQNQNGCDSLIIIETTLNNSDEVTITELSCISNDVGIFIDTLFNLNGCDSIVNTIVELAPQDSTYINLQTCDLTEVDSYEAILSNQYGCDSTIFIQVEYFTDLDLSFEISQPDCFNVDDGSIMVMVSGGAGDYNYSLNGGPFQEDPFFTNLSNGEYEITVQDAEGCILSDVFIINAVLLVTVELGEDLTIELGNEAEITSIVNIPIDSIALIEWSPLNDLDCDNCFQQTVTPIITTSYQVVVTSTSGCTDTDDITINVELNKDVYIPNVISVNNDGRNDDFLIFANEGVISNIKTFQGFDRWGNKIWEYNDIPPNEREYGWDGRINDKEVDSGVFVWLAEIEFVDGTTEVFAGDLTVIR